MTKKKTDHPHFQMSFFAPTCRHDQLSLHLSSCKGGIDRHSPATPAALLLCQEAE
jgi:hypothetical protein